MYRSQFSEIAQKVYSSQDLEEDNQGKRLSHVGNGQEKKLGETDQEKGFKNSLILFDGVSSTELLEFRQKYLQSTLLNM